MRKLSVSVRANISVGSAFESEKKAEKQTVQKGRLKVCVYKETNFLSPLLIASV